MSLKNKVLLVMGTTNKLRYTIRNPVQEFVSLRFKLSILYADLVDKNFSFVFFSDQFYSTYGGMHF